ncbi:MAG TPA: hypothetical protein VFA26_06195, partial [Gemmataceae bacterium]|nr:hypothetical protein [Gemmataceae bacterium]
GARLAARWTGTAWRGVLVAGSLLGAVALAAHAYLPEFTARAVAAPPLAVGLGAERRELVEILQAHTTTAGRILWEDRPGPPGSSRWTALLPLLTGRAYLGGLDPNPGIEHGFVSFCDQLLAGRLLADWSDAQLDDFCRRYNVGWVVCWSPAAVGRFRAWKRAEAVATLSDGGPGCLFAVRRPLSYALKGEARLVQADGERIALSDLVPEGGEIILSLHYQAGLRATPGRVLVERELDPYDPIAFVRLRVAGPVPRVSLTWDRR